MKLIIIIIIIIIIIRFITSFINILKYIHSSISRLKTAQDPKKLKHHSHSLHGVKLWVQFNLILKHHHHKEPKGLWS